MRPIRSLILATALLTAPVLVASPVMATGPSFVAADWGLDFRHTSAASGQRYMVETMVGGVVIFDYDNYVDDDVFF
ncbi:MAG: hypothetical protein AAGD38_15510, partial [Acidobacteriota bacterium]